jgi:hypothetical protein
MADEPSNPVARPPAGPTAAASDRLTIEQLNQITDAEAVRAAEFAKSVDAITESLDAIKEALPSTHNPAPTVRGWAKWKPFLESALVAAIVSGAVSALGLVWLESRLENSKEHVAAIVRQKDKFDNAQTTIFSEITQYTGKLFAKPEQPPDKNQLQTAIIGTLLQLNSFKDELPRSDHDVLDKYADALQDLSKQLRDVKSPNDLGPIYQSAQNLLILHDQLNERIHNDLDVSLFSSRRS